MQKSRPYFNVPQGEGSASRDNIDTNTETATAANSNPQNGDNLIGYKRPPAASRFKKGISGNPNGRPRKIMQRERHVHAYELEDIIAHELWRPHTVLIDGHEISAPAITHIIQSHIRDAMAGDQKSFQTILEPLYKLPASRERSHRQFREDALRYKTEKLTEIAEFQKLGMRFDHIIPHPDHIFVDVRGRVNIIGPCHLGEKRAWDQYALRRENLKEQLKKFEDTIRHSVSHDERDDLFSQRQKITRKITKINDILPDFYTPDHAKSLYAQNYRNSDAALIVLDPKDLTLDQKEAILVAIEAANNEKHQVQNSRIEPFVPELRQHRKRSQN